MILGQAEQDLSYGTLARDVWSSAVGGVVTGLWRLVGGEPSGGDVQAAAEGATPLPPESVGDVTDVVGEAKATARRPSASSGTEGEGYLAPSSSRVWPWILGIGVLGGGIYWYVKRRKRSGNKRKRG